MILEVAIGSYFSAASLYALTLAVSGKFYRTNTFSEGHRTNNIAVLIPAYKEDGVIVSVARKALKQQYDQAAFDVIIIADSLQPSTIAALKALPVRLVEVSFEKSTKVKALRAAMEQIPHDYDMALILDADNIMEDHFLQKINHAYNIGARVVQARRVAKNLDSSFAILDAFSEIVNNHIFRKGAQALGLSSPFIGSGMSFPFHLLRYTLTEMEAVGGFDREMQVRIVERGYRIDYLEGAVVQDEKVSKAEVFGHQRKRWLSSQFTYIRKFFKKGMKALVAGNMDLFNMTILNNIFLPRVMILGILGIFTILALAFSGFVYIPFYYWLALLGINVIAMLLAVPLQFYNKAFFVAMLSVPKAFLVMFRSFLKIRGANKEFIHTPHTS